MTPPPYQVSYSVAYDTGTDAFIFTFAAYYSPVSVPRVGFSHVTNSSIPNGVTFLSTVGEANGVTVSWALCSSPVGSSEVDLYNKIVALYTSGGGGSGVVSVGTTDPIINTGTSSNPVIAHANSGVTTGTYALAKPTVNATGHVTGIVAGSSSDITSALGYTPVQSVSFTPPLTNTGTLSAVVGALAASGVTAGSYTSANVTVNALGLITSIANGSGGGGAPPGLFLRSILWTRGDNFPNSITNGGALTFNSLSPLVEYPMGTNPTGEFSITGPAIHYSGTGTIYFATFVFVNYIGVIKTGTTFNDLQLDLLEAGNPTPIDSVRTTVAPSSTLAGNSIKNTLALFGMSGLTVGSPAGADLHSVKATVTNPGDYGSFDNTMVVVVFGVNP